MKLTQETVERLVRIWNAAKTAAEVATQLGEKESSIRGAIRKLRKAGVELKRMISGRPDPMQSLDLDAVKKAAGNGNPNPDVPPAA